MKSITRFFVKEKFYEKYVAEKLSTANCYLWNFLQRGKVLYVKTFSVWKSFQRHNIKGSPSISQKYALKVNPLVPGVH